eukprot:353438-Chlamydomonas_euryale.AAC.3
MWRSLTRSSSGSLCGAGCAPARWGVCGCEAACLCWWGAHQMACLCWWGAHQMAGQGCGQRQAAQGRGASQGACWAKDGHTSCGHLMHTYAAVLGVTHGCMLLDSRPRKTESRKGNFGF